MDKLNGDSFGTHKPVLIELVKNTTGNIIECGCGNSSTILIKELIKNTNRILISLESNLEWYNKFKHLENDNHKLFYIDIGNEDNENTGKYWTNFIKNNNFINGLSFDICFIDQSPWTARTYTMNYFKNICPYLIVHDVDYFPLNNKWGNIKKEYSLINKHNYKIIKRDMDFSDVVINFKVFYPPDEYFAYKTGPPTLLCSNIISSEDFHIMCNQINYLKYC